MEKYETQISEWIRRLNGEIALMGGLNFVDQQELISINYGEDTMYFEIENLEEYSGEKSYRD